MARLKTRRGAVRCRDGFTLAEAAVSTIIVAVMMGAALNSVAKTGQFRRVSNEQQLGHLFAEQLMAEILSKSYWDPAFTTPTAIGPSPQEKAAGNRTLFNDVDDYHGWLESPPAAVDGASLVNGQAWYRRVEVSFVQWADLNTPISTDVGLKRIMVDVGRVRPGGNPKLAADRRSVTSLVAIAGRGRGI